MATKVTTDKRMKITQKTLLCAIDMAVKEQDNSHISCLLTSKELLLLKRLGYRLTLSIDSKNKTLLHFDLKTKDVRMIDAPVCASVCTESRTAFITDGNICYSDRLQGLPYPISESQTPIQFSEEEQEARLEANGIHIW